MSDTFLPGNGFDTYESQDKVLIQMADTAACAVAVRILQQQGFAVAALPCGWQPNRPPKRKLPSRRPKSWALSASC